MSKLKYKKLKVDFADVLLPDAAGGHAGRKIEDIMISQGFPLQNGVGADLKQQKIEVKSRDMDATSARTIGSMTADDIVNTPYAESNIFDKTQTQFIVKSRNNSVVKSGLFDFTCDYVQSHIKDAYEAAREKFIAGDRGNYIRGEINGVKTKGYFERKQQTNSWDFRLPSNTYDKFEDVAATAPQFNKLFNEET